MMPAPWRFHGRTLENMKRVVILGRGASGKSTLARCLGDITQLPVIELDKVFWRPGLAATARDQWVIVQEKLVAEDGWIMDGDLGSPRRCRGSASSGGHCHFHGLLLFVLCSTSNPPVARAYRLLVVDLGVPLEKPPGSPESDRWLRTECEAPSIS
jgi:adenylate kinase family enzyme